MPSVQNSSATIAIKYGRTLIGIARGRRILALAWSVFR